MKLTLIAERLGWRVARDVELGDGFVMAAAMAVVASRAGFELAGSFVVMT